MAQDLARIAQPARIPALQGAMAVRIALLVNIREAVLARAPIVRLGSTLEKERTGN